MCNPIPYFTGFFTITENLFNAVGYLPRNEFPTLHAWGVKWRKNQGIFQLITGLALAALGYSANYLIPTLATGYMNLPLQAVSLGLLLANHGTFNIIRAYMEKMHIPGLTLVYDFYGKKVLPALNYKFDLLNALFSKIKNLVDQMIFISAFPPQFIHT